jgi:hypothetical protein
MKTSHARIAFALLSIFKDPFDARGGASVPFVSELLYEITQAHHPL